MALTSHRYQVTNQEDTSHKLSSQKSQIKKRQVRIGSDGDGCSLEMVMWWWGEAQHVIISNSGSGQGPTVLAIQRVWLLTIFPIFYLISTGCKYQLQPVKISNICVLTPSLLSLITREETPVSRDQSPANWCRGRLCLDTQDKRYQHLFILYIISNNSSLSVLFETTICTVLVEPCSFSLRMPSSGMMLVSLLFSLSMVTAEVTIDLAKATFDESLQQFCVMQKVC